MSDCQHQTRGLKESGVQNQRQLSTEEREKFLDAITDCLANIEKDSDIEGLERYLEQLDPENELGADFDLNRSLDEFYQKYEMGSSNKSEGQSASVAKKKNHRFFRCTARIAIIAAILCSFVVAAQASGFDILRVIAEWTNAQFHLEWITTTKPDITQTDEVEYTSLQDTLLSYGIEIPLVPTNFPDGSELVDTSAHEETDHLLITAEYKLPAGNLYITMRNNPMNSYASVPFSDIEKDASDVSVYQSGGIKHYIVSDVAMNKAVWQNETWECRIAGDIEHNELIAMIDSIYDVKEGD